MMKRFWPAVVAVVVGGVVAASAEPMRTLVVKEDMTPNKGHWEFGGTFGYQEITDPNSELSDASYSELALYARYGLTKDFSFNVEVPIANSDFDGGSSFGLGDLVLGADLVGFEDTLGYPYVMPYVRLALPTGDEDEALGAGETQVKFGAAIGTTVDDDWDFILDVGFMGRSETENSFVIGGAVVYKFSEKFSMHVEGQLDIPRGDEFEDVGTLLGGMVYRPAEGWLVGLYGGVESGDIDDNVIGAAKLAYAFE